MFVCFGTIALVFIVVNYECVDAIFMWTAPPPAWNQTVPAGAVGGAALIQTVVIQVTNGTTDYPLRWNYTLMDGQTISITFFSVLGTGDIGLVVSPGGVGEITTINDVNDYQSRFRLQSDKKSSTLTIITVNERENATFQCRFQVGANQWAYNVRIEVTVPPGITHISGNQTVTEGQNVTLTCTASGYPAPNITWTRFSDNSTVTMPLINIRRQDEGGYRCTVDNDVGNPATRDTYIVVHYKPDNVTLEANATENEDCSAVLWVNFTCVASEANPAVYNYQLFGNEDLFSPDGTWPQEISEKGKHDYSCLAQHPSGNVTSSRNVTVTFNVLVQISADLITGSNTPRRGEDVALCCHASGFPEPTITWSKVLFNTLVEINSTKCLNFTDIKEDKSGMYVCQANNTCGKRNSSVIPIKVLHPPDNVILNASISSGKVCAAKMVQFTCKAGAAEPEVDNYTLYQNDAAVANRIGSGVFTLWLNSSGHFIYLCKANNSEGTGTSNDITFAVEVPVQISANLTTGSKTPRRDEDVALYCNASGFLEPTITWSKVLSNTLVEITSSKWLNFTNIKEYKSGMYICQANNTCGKRNSSVITITVLHKPENVTLNASVASGKVCAPIMVQFMCKAGAAEPEVDNYALYQNDTVIANMSGSGVFTLWLNTSGHFIYKCEANNSEGTGTSTNTLTFIMEEGASVTSANGSIVRVKEGDNVTISCIPSGVSNISWSYTMNDVLEFGSSLLVPNISRDLNGSAIECSASNACGNDSKLTYVVVQYAPENVMLSKDISSDKVCVGKMVQFTCKAGAANPEVERYTLHRNGTVIANMSSSGISTLWLNTTGIFIYKCEADNSVGTGTSNSISVTVEGRFSVISVSPKTVVKEGDSVILFCNVTGDPAPNVNWVDASNQVTNSGATWPLPNITRSRNGTYSCVASNACGKDNKTTTIVVQYAPENVMLSKDSSSDKVCVGKMVQFTCKAGATNPQVERYTLHRNGTVIANMSSSGVSTLWLNTTGIFIYKCEANNSVGTGTSNSISVTVEGPFSVTSVSVSPKEEVLEGENVTLFCNVTGDPAPKVVWVHASSQDTNIGATWSLPNISRSRNGTYSCVASNACGEDNKTTTIVVQFLSKSPAEDQACGGSFFKNADCSVNAASTGAVAAGAAVLIAIMAIIVGCTIHKKRKCRKDTRIAHDPASEERRLQGDDPYAQVNNGYAETGPRSVNSREKAAAVPDYAVVDKSAKKNKKKQDEEKPPEYAVVDKSKKKKKNEKGDDTYAKVDMSKKTSKKKPRPGEDMLYADLGDFSGASQMPTVATSPKAQAQLPPIKRPEPYEGTQYADITQFLKGDATLPIDDKQVSKQGTELKEKDEKTDGTGGENAPKETPM